MTESIFHHIQAPVPSDCTFKISPSSIGDFFNYPSVWYKDHILKEKQFTGSTASTIGTCVHYIAEQFALGKRPTREFMEAQIDALDNPDIDNEEVKTVFPDLATLLVNEHVRQRIPDLVEQSYSAEVAPGIYLAGTLDAIVINNHNTPYETYWVQDYKSSSTKPSSTMPFGYKMQQMAYAYMLRAQGHTVEKISLIYVTRPTKTLPARLFPIHHIITNQDWQAIEDVLSLISESVQLVRNQPELTHLIFKSMALKVN